MQTLFYEDTKGCSQDTVITAQREFSEGKLKIELPAELKEMDDERRAEFYPYEERPDLIFEDEEKLVQVTLQFFDEKMEKEDTYRTILKMQDLIEDAFPKYRQSPAYLFKKGQIPAGWFLMKMEDRQMEHVKIIFSIKGKMVLLTVTYPETDRAKWRVLIRFMMASVKEAG